MKNSLLAFFCVSLLLACGAQAGFWDSYEVLFGQQNFQYSGSPDQGNENVQLGLDQLTGSGFKSKYPYLFGYLSMKIKLVGGNSAGTVTSFYMASVYEKWSELDFEFLGNTSGAPYILQTNVFSEGVGQREQRIYLWFDPTADYHEYGVLWNKNLILFMVDGKVIRVFHNTQYLGIPYLNYQPMFIYTSIWDGSTWATCGGTVPADWSLAPFKASYSNFNTKDACAVTTEPPPYYATPEDVSLCSSQADQSWYGNDPNLALTQTQIDDLRWIKSNYIVYDYCTDLERYNWTVPPECAVNWP
ncbi:hypothetical protein R1flu_025192 [Riccia fluitans]|uniref:Xyloglucan endotransglucosylase/hydrolase n=1 Tax=Riccia fluitans TaxID=41844 RepID=A0ABD1XX12_9MARC